MAHSTADIIKAQDDFLRASRALLNIYAGKMQAIENSVRAVKMGTEVIHTDEEPLDLSAPPPITPADAKPSRIKALAEKMAGAA